MPRYAYVNGRYVHHRDGAVHIEDRGYQFADGVYEVVPVHKGTLVDEEAHLDRLERSLNELRMEMPMSRTALRMVCKQLMRRNALTNGFLYMQVTRGVAPRDHKFPKPGTPPALVMTTRQLKPASAEKLDKGYKVITIPDIRWARRDIKSVSLLPNILGKQMAVDAGCDEAWQVDAEGKVTEGTATNAWIVTEDRKVVTREANHDILSGITRLSLLKVIEAEGYELEIRPFSVEEAYAAKEAFLTSSTNYVTPITKIDDQVLGNGHAGILTMKLREAYIEQVVHGKATKAASAQASAAVLESAGR